MRATDHFTVISSDCHAGANHATYREYLEQRYLDDFDAWRGGYKNPFRDLQDDGRTRNWDNDRRISEQETDGVVAEVIYPNTVPPFFPTGQHIARPPTPEEYEHRLAGIRAHNRWLRDFCAEYPERRAGIGQLFVNDLDDAIEDARWIAESGLRGGVLVPAVPDDCKWLEPIHSPSYDRLWAELQDLDLTINMHSGSGAPDYGPYPASGVIWLIETQFFSRRSLVNMVMSGVFERFPGLRYALAEIGVAWVPPTFTQLDETHARMSQGRVGELGFSADVVLPHPPSFYLRRNCWFGAAFPTAPEIAARDYVGVDRIMWGSDYPHHESCYPHSRENMRAAFAGVAADEVRMMLTDNAATLYRFDVDALRRLTDAGPTVEEIVTA